MERITAGPDLGAGLGRALLLFTAASMVASGATIALIGMTRVFVLQDLEYMGTTAEALRALNPRLVPLIAHDRAGFGSAIGIHPLVGYLSFSHLLPALVGAVAFTAGIALLRAPLCGAEG